MSRLKLFLFGPPRIEQNHKLIGVRPRKALALLVYLAVTRQPHSRDTLATLFWPESDQQAARASLRRMLYQLTQSVDKDVIYAEQEMVEISPKAEVWLDVAAFQQAAATCLSPQSSEKQVDAAHTAHLAELVDLYTDDFLAGFHLPSCPEFDDWQFFQREDLRELLTRILQQLVSIHTSRGDYDLAISFARRWLA